MENRIKTKFFEAINESDILKIKELFSEYANSLRFSLDFQNFQLELQNLPGEYTKPEGN